MFRQELQQMYAELNRKADIVQRRAEAIDQVVQALNAKIRSMPGAGRLALIAEREELYAKQESLVLEAQQLRDLAVNVLDQDAEIPLRLYLQELLVAQNGALRQTVEELLQRRDGAK